MSLYVVDDDQRRPRAGCLSALHLLICHIISKKRLCFPSRVSCVSSGESNLNVGTLGDRTLEVCPAMRLRYPELHVVESAVLCYPQAFLESD